MKRLLILVIAILALTACNQGVNITSTPEPQITPTKTPSLPKHTKIIYPDPGFDLAPYSSQYDHLASRIKEFDGTLKISLEILSTEISTDENQLILNLRLKFINVSSNEFYIFKPSWMAVIQEEIWDLYSNISLHLEDSSGSKIQFLCHCFITRVLASFPTDYYLLKPGEVFEKDYSVGIPPYYSSEPGFNLEEGYYQIYVEYENLWGSFLVYPIMINYQIFTDAQIEQYFNEYVKVADINAWVGNLQSNKVEFYLPKLTDIKE